VDPETVIVGGVQMQKLSAATQADLSGVTNVSLALEPNSVSHVSIEKNYSGGKVNTYLKFGMGSPVKAAIGGTRRASIFKYRLKGKTTKAKVIINKSFVKKKKVSQKSHSRVRGAEDEMIEIEPDEEYVVLQDGPLVLTFDVEEEPITIEGITLGDPDPNDLNLDGDVNAADIVKSIAEGKTQAEIDAIVNSIMDN
jgi:hypothetical protein